MTSAWDPSQYGHFAAERDRPAMDLFQALPKTLAPATIWDLGCGPGGQLVWMSQHWPHAALYGLDSSEAMVAEAQQACPQAQVLLGSIEAWSPSGSVDLIWSNAALHWLNDHETLLPRLAGHLATGGVLAVQMPIGHSTPHHQALRETAESGPWAEMLQDVRRTPPLLSPHQYVDLLAEAGCRAEVWTTTYFHPLRGKDPVLEWMKGAALRPYLAALRPDPELTEAFLAALAERLERAYPADAAGITLLPFPRLFLTGQRRQAGGALPPHPFART